ncbi:MAG: hypothetical protein H0W12_09385 [Chitinophagaceae bacterium]|nr:hypothetical protein [Chitinophagaceae bacterium]
MRLTSMKLLVFLLFLCILASCNVSKFPSIDTSEFLLNVTVRDVDDAVDRVIKQCYEYPVSGPIDVKHDLNNVVQIQIPFRQRTDESINKIWKDLYAMNHVLAVNIIKCSSFLK